MKKLIITLFFITLLLPSYAQVDTTFSTFAFAADLHDPFTGRITEIYSLLDENYRTHIAWVRDDQNTRDVMYSVYDNSSVQTYVVDDDISNEIKRYPTLVLDDNNRPHLAWFVKRDNDQSCCPSGNYAVMYAGDPDGDGNFEVKQVSTNPTDPTSNTATEYTDAYVNHSPAIFIDQNGGINVAYFSDTYASIGYEQYLIIATKSGSGWNYDEAIVMDGINIYSQDYPILPKRTGSNIVGGVLDISPDDLEIFYESGGAYALQTITNNPDHDVEHAQTFIDNSNTQHIFYTDNNVQTDLNTIYHYTIGVGTFSFIESIVLEQYVPSNFTYAAYDKVLDDFFFMYRGNYSGSEGAYAQRLSMPLSGGGRKEVDANFKSALGDRTFNVYNGFISHVTGSLSEDSIFVTTNVIPTSGPVTANFEPLSAEVNLGESVQFTDLSTGNPNEWSWTFEGGTPSSSSEQSPSVAYHTAGTYSVTLTVSNEGGSSNTKTVTEGITVIDPEAILTPEFTASDTLIEIGSSVTFTDNSNGSPTSWGWQFVGGTPSTSTEQNPTITYNSTGEFDVSLTVGNADSTATITEVGLINVIETVTADFSVDAEEVRPNADVTFSDLSSGNPTAWSWTFEGATPSTSNEQNPVVAYDSIGIYGVTLEVSNSTTSDVESKEGFITVTEFDGQLIIAFSADKTEVIKFQNVQFTDESIGSPSSWSWSFEGGTPSTSTEQNPSISYDSVGTFDVVLEVSNGDSTGTLTKTEYITVASDEELDPIFSADKQTVFIGDTVQFTDQSTGDPERWEWEFEGGNPGTSEVQNPSVVYEELGSYYVRLEIFQGNLQARDTQADFIQVVERPDSLEVDFTQDKTEITVGDSISFSDLSVGEPVEWNWEFPGGEPATSTDQNPVITYPEPGTYSVTLSISDTTTTQSITKEDLVFVKDTILIADFVADTTVIVIGQSVQFTDRSSGVVTSFEWHFEGGTPETSTLENPIVQYNQEGSFEVKLVVNDGQKTDTLIRSAFMQVYDPEGCDGMTTFTSSNGTFEDGSGPFEYAAYLDCSWLIAASGIESLALIFRDLHIGDGDTLNIYDGGDDQAELLVSYTNEELQESINYSSSNIVFITFKSDSVGLAGGWEILYEEALVADFSSDVLEVEAGNSVVFSNQSTGGFTELEWSFDGGSPETSTEENPSILYEEGGTYDVTLSIANELQFVSEAKSDYITVLDVSLGSDEVRLSYYPNPTRRYIYIKSEGFKTASIIDLSGNKLKTFSTNLLDLNELSSGSYIIQIETVGGDVINRRIVKK
ncbi:Por secretion system C-terminal sorting domain-containing protein [Ekhidna lutea]|uniref:Por secretion system C-terminal sorting domain-containing protein n=1 Tax=Ekhidna lutea TaxID=447679 RepID=A0A239ERN5_EKHLU|nr:PKD domain-containing protein [Ekhidna lutea]SNS46918.1 Por secretion system C-terminal sorting domain-containing protein [Ekhidna lutea]